jgi:plastocyanin
MPMLSPIHGAAMHITGVLSAAGMALLVCGAGSDVHAAGKARTHTIVIEAMRYSPPTLDVAVGDIVVWKNKDPFPHTATAEDRSFDSQRIAADRSWKFKVRKKGVFPYVCTLHPTMKGELVVK